MAGILDELLRDSAAEHSSQTGRRVQSQGCFERDGLLVSGTGTPNTSKPHRHNSHHATESDMHYDFLFLALSDTSWPAGDPTCVPSASKDLVTYSDSHLLHAVRVIVPKTMSRSTVREEVRNAYGRFVDLSSKAQGHVHDDGCPDCDAQEHQPDGIQGRSLHVEIPERHIGHSCPAEGAAKPSQHKPSQQKRWCFRAKAQKLGSLDGIAEKRQVHHILQSPKNK